MGLLISIVFMFLLLLWLGPERVRDVVHIVSAAGAPAVISPSGGEMDLATHCHSHAALLIPPHHGVQGVVCD